MERVCYISTQRDAIERDLQIRGYTKVATAKTVHWIGLGGDEVSDQILPGEYRIRIFQIEGASGLPQHEEWIEFERLPNDSTPSSSIAES